MKMSSKCLTLTMILLLLAGAAHAIPIEGDIGMIGFGFPAIDPLNATEIPEPYMALVTVATGNFARYIQPRTVVDYNGFTLNPATSPVADHLWAVGGFSFVLESVDVVYRDNDQLVLDGFGTLYGNGFDATAGNWGMTIDAQLTNFNFSNSTTAAPVPEPATMFLFGTGLIGLAGLGRKKFKM